MSADCIFCKIVRGEIPAHKIYEDAVTLAFLDIHPLADGHSMVIPKPHYEKLEDVPLTEAGKIFETVRRVTAAIQKAFKAPGATIGINNGRAAGQVVPHLHIHIIPRFPGDGGGTIHSIIRGPSKHSLGEVHKMIAAELER